MKGFLVIAVLAALTFCNDASDVKSDKNEVTQYHGEVKQGDIQFLNNIYYVEPRPYTYQTKFVEWVGAPNARATDIRITEPNISQGSNARIIGGLGSNRVTLELTSALGRTIWYRIEIWGYYA